MAFCEVVSFLTVTSGRGHPRDVLWRAYTGYCNQARRKTINERVWGTRMTRDYGPRRKRDVTEEKSTSEVAPRRYGYEMVARGEVAND